MKHIQKRLFLGNLPPKVLKRDVVNKLQEFGNVQSVEMKQRTDDDGNILSSFAFVDIEIDTGKLYSCFHRFQSEPWGDHKVKVEVARESFMDRLKREQEEAKLSGNKFKNSDVNGNLDQNYPQNDKDTFSCKKMDPTKDHSAPSHKSMEKRNSKSSKTREELSPESMLDENHSAIPKVEKTESETVDTSHNKKSHKRFGVLSMFAGSKNSKNLDDSEDNVRNDSRRESLKSVESESEEEVERKRHGCLPMFSGTKNLKDLSDKDHNKDPKKRKNCTSTDISSPPKKLKSELLSTNPEIKPLKALNVFNEELAVKNKIYKAKDGDSEKRTKKSKTEMKAEEKRLNALEVRNKAINLQKEAVKKALLSVDMKTNPNKIVFDDEDSEGSEKIASGKKPMEQQKDGSSKPNLFDEDSDDEDLKEMEKKDFKIKPQFEGPKGHKLLAIQSRYGNDTRFNLDERFLESDDETELEKQGDGKDEMGEDLNAEKTHQLSILQEMLGIDISTKPKRREDSEKRKSIPMIRFDPSNPEHSKYLIKEGKKEKEGKDETVKEKKSKKKEEEEEKKEEEKKVPTSSERFYEVSDRLKESLKRRNEKSEDSKDDERRGSNGFSLLKKFGSAPSDSEKEEEEFESYSTRPIKGRLHEWDKNPFKYDSSDEDEEDTIPLRVSKENVSEEASGKKNADYPSAPVESFLFREDDPRLEEGFEFFRVNKTFEEMKEGFQEKRTDLKSIIKAKLKNNKKKKLPFKKKLGGLRRKFPKGRR